MRRNECVLEEEEYHTDREFCTREHPLPDRNPATSCVSTSILIFRCIQIFILYYSPATHRTNIPSSTILQKLLFVTFLFVWFCIFFFFSCSNMLSLIFNKATQESYENILIYILYFSKQKKKCHITALLNSRI